MKTLAISQSTCGFLLCRTLIGSRPGSVFFPPSQKQTATRFWVAVKWNPSLCPNNKLDFGLILKIRQYFNVWWNLTLKEEEADADQQQWQHSQRSTRWRRRTLVNRVYFGNFIYFNMPWRVVVFFVGPRLNTRYDPYKPDECHQRRFLYVTKNILISKVNVKISCIIILKMFWPVCVIGISKDNYKILLGWSRIS